MDRIQRLRKAKEILADAEASPDVRVEAAASELWSALFHDGEALPQELRESAESIQRRILAGGTIRWTVQRMTAAEIEQTAGELLRLIAAAQQMKATGQSTDQQSPDPDHGPLQT